MSSQSEALPSALDNWDSIREEIGQRKPALFLDYDGTLTPIVRRPELAVLSDDMRATITRLAERLPVAVISGRDLQDVRRLVDLDGLVYAGSHGYQIEKPGGWRKELDEAARFLTSLDRANRLLEESLEPVSGAFVERKSYSVVAHYRLAGNGDLDALRQAVNRTADACPDLRLTHGKKVYELVPDFEWNKGKALLWLRETLQLDESHFWPVFLGDDITDEYAFAVVKDGGTGILVRDEPRQTDARYALDSVEEVRQFLLKLL